ncbi:MAG: TIR domain-containing protein [Maribacter sp.]
MGIFDWLFEAEKPKKKRIFISFAIEDIEYRNHLVDQAKKKHSPFEFIDMSVKKKWKQNEWKVKCRRKIKGCDGVIALLSKRTHLAHGARWEIKCAREENVKIIGMHIQKKNKGAIPTELQGKRVVEWNWPNLEKFINRL